MSVRRLNSGPKVFDFMGSPWEDGYLLQFGFAVMRGANESRECAPAGSATTQSRTAAPMRQVAARSLPSGEHSRNLPARIGELKFHLPGAFGLYRITPAIGSCSRYPPLVQRLFRRAR